MNKTVVVDGVEYTFEQAFRNMWKEISENFGMTKEEYFYKHKSPEEVWNNCFACEYCNYCPIILWRENEKKNDSQIPPCINWRDMENNHYKGLYGIWGDLMEIGYFVEASDVARRISELEWKEV